MRDAYLRPVRNPDKFRSYFFREKGLVLLIALCGILFDGGLSTVLLLQGNMIDTIATKQPIPKVLQAAGLFMLATLVVQLARFGKRYFVRRFANKSQAAMRMMVYNDIVNKDITVLKDESMGELLTKAVGDVDITVEGMRKCTTEVFDTGLLMVSYLISLISLSPSITLFSSLSIVCAMVLAGLMKKTVIKASRENRESLADVTNHTYALVDHATLLRTTGMEGKERGKYQGELEILRGKAVKASLMETALEPLYRAIAASGIVFALSFGGNQVITGTWSIGNFSSFLFIFSAFTVKAGKASGLFNAFQKASVSFARIKPYLKPYQEEDVTIHHSLDMTKGLVVKDLSFTYPKNTKPTIAHVTFQAKRGEIIGITGAVASGKSTLGIALEGLYPYEGSITLGGRELSSLTGYEKGVAISYQGHQSELLSDTIQENVSFGIGGDITPSLKDVSFLADLADMRDGTQTIVGSAGVRLSGGQAARISLARALYRHTPLVILDDPFASVDRKTEEEIISNIRNGHGSSIVIVISHRLSIFPATNQVLFVNQDGTVVTGTHKSLMETCEAYRAMYLLQMGDGK